jgi:Zn-dependent peptidase ImmA (M78 family)
MREFWIKSAYIHFEKINNINDYDRNRLVDLMSKIRPYTMNVTDGLKIVSQALYSCGVTVIYQQHLPTTQVRGATFIVNNKPCIALTDLNKNYATLWFALMHELHHVLFDFEEIKKQVFHLTGETDLFLLQEDKANEFSRQYLLSYEDSNYISAHIDNSFIVREFAKEKQIHPSLIYNFYCHDNQKSGKGSYWAKFKHLMPDVGQALKDFNLNSFQGKSIEESISEIKETVFNF